MRVSWKRTAALAVGLWMLFFCLGGSGLAEDADSDTDTFEEVGWEEDEDETGDEDDEDDEEDDDEEDEGENYGGWLTPGYGGGWQTWVSPYGSWIPYSPSGTSSSSSDTGVPTSEVIPVTAEVVESEANIREKANSSASLLVRLGPGDQVTLLGQTTGADNRVWYRVQCGNGITGYVRYDRVDVICGTAQFGGSTEPTGKCVGQTNTRAVNVRLQMSTGSDRIRLLRKGQSVTVICRAADAFGTPWYYVRIPTGPLGYIHGSYLTVISGTAADAYRGRTDASADVSGGYDVSGVSGVSGASGASGGYGSADSASVQAVIPQAADTTAASAQETGTLPAASAEQDEVLYLRYILEHLAELNAEGSGYKGYSLQDFDGDGVRELMVNCGVETGYGWRVFTCEGGNQIVDLGRIEGYGYYAARPGGGILVLRWGETSARYALIRKAGSALVQICELEKNTDAAGNAVWNLDRKIIAEDTLRALLADFPEDTLLNLGIAPGSAGTLDPETFGLESLPTDSAWPETQQTPGPDDVVNG